MLVQIRLFIPSRETKKTLHFVCIFDYSSIVKNFTEVGPGYSSSSFTLECGGLSIFRCTQVSMALSDFYSILV